MKIQRLTFAALVALLALWFVSPLRAAENTTTGTSLHCLWKVAGPSNAVYLLGSIHLLKRSDYPLGAAIESAFTNSGVVAFETDIEKLQSPETQMLLLGKSQLPEGETLEQQLTPGTYARFSNYVSQAGLPLMIFNRMKPFVAVAALTVIELQKLELDPEFGVDKYFFGRATKDGKRIVPLETVEFQLDLITGFSKAEGELVMKCSLADMDKTRRQFKEIVQAWQTGDATKLAGLLNEATREAPVIFKRLVTDRNRDWLPKIETLLAGQTNAIVIVGAGHLVGNEGVVELLKKKGRKVTQL